MENLDKFAEFLPLLIPILVLQLALMIAALVDLAKRERTRGPRWMWVLIILVGEFLGSILYFIVGREE
ncbi:MAG TPA: transcriptional regulator [Anaerolineaceae bacterium]|jgi:hypothetical protein|nr:transcriptional regulator [Anaerolineaceae bacterium]